MTDSNRGSARYTTLYTKEEIAAYLEATITNGIKPMEAMKRAMAGTLKDGVGPFGSKAKSGKLVFGYTLNQTYGEAYIARNPALQAEDTHAIALALHEANKRDAKAIAESETATMTERTRAAKDLAESYKALASVEPRETRPTKEKASVNASEQPGAEPSATPDVLAQLDAIASTVSHNANTSASQDNGAPGPVHSLAR